MLATLIDSELFRRGQTRRCFISALGVTDSDMHSTLKRFNRLLSEGTSNEHGLSHLAVRLGMDKDKLVRANRVTLMLHNTRQAAVRFAPYIEFVLQGNEESPDSVMLLAQEQWKFSMPLSDGQLQNPQMELERDFSGARQLYKKRFIANKGRCFGRRIEGFRYYWAKDQAIEFDIYGLVKVIVPSREPPKKRYVSRHVLRAVGKPKLLVIHGN